MDCGFETIGNATIICYDGGPVLATDPWVTGHPYFGSWTCSHAIPEEQDRAIRSCPFIWFSHGHPDHLNPDSVGLFKAKQIYLPDHQGGRIRRELVKNGYQVRVLPDREWVQISDRIRILCIADFNQDAILLIDINGRLLINQNDAIERGWAGFVRRIAREHPVSFLLALSGYGDADMINFYDEQGVSTPGIAKSFPVGKTIALRTEALGVKHFVPFSSMHRYQRRDSIWANRYLMTPADYHEGFDSKVALLLPRFIRYDCNRDSHEEIRPPETPEQVFEPEAFEDRWSDPLDRKDFGAIENYFQSIHHLNSFLGFINLRVGGVDNVVELNRRQFNRGITFEVPRHSLSQAVRYEIFDDLLIGNFMKTTLHGSWAKTRLYPDFTPYVAKYADNGRAKTAEELRAYFDAYCRRAPLDYFRHWIETKGRTALVSRLSAGSPLYHLGKRAYWTLKKATS